MEKSKVPEGKESMRVSFQVEADRIRTPQKNTPTSVAGCFSATDWKIRSQLGRPYCSAKRAKEGKVRHVAW